LKKRTKKLLSFKACAGGKSATANKSFLLLFFKKEVLSSCLDLARYTPFLGWLFISEAERQQIFDVRLRLTKLLFSRISNLVMVGLAGLLSGVYAYARDSESFVLAVAVAGFLCVAVRCAGIRIFKARLAQGLRFDPERWTIFYGLTALGSSICWGVVSFCCLAFSHDHVLCMISVVCNTATGGSLAARNAAAPRIVQVQLLASLVPIMAGAFFAGDNGYLFLVLAVPGLIYGLMVVANEINAQLLDLYDSQIKLISLSNTDYLTQIPNRRYFGECCSDALAARRASLQPFTILMIDVDYFKGFNDLYGHPAGDICLQRIAQRLQLSLRSTDSVVSRYGGEEFAVLLRNTNEAAGALIAQRLCDAIAEAGIPHANRKDGLDIVTISVGAATTDSADSGYDSIINAADQALYRAKTLGRNRVCMGLAA
jgi:diguanylate cyclase (GGDEF)-like protein